MHATLTFDLPRQQRAMDLAARGYQYHRTLCRLDAEVRGRLQDEPLHPARRAECEFLRDLLYRLMADEGVTFE
jgi:hypothetical protein